MTRWSTCAENWAQNKSWPNYGDRWKFRFISTDMWNTFVPNFMAVYSIAVEIFHSKPQCLGTTIVYGFRHQLWTIKLPVPVHPKTFVASLSGFFPVMSLLSLKFLYKRTKRVLARDKQDTFGICTTFSAQPFDSCEDISWKQWTMTSHGLATVENIVNAKI